MFIKVRTVFNRSREEEFGIRNYGQVIIFMVNITAMNKNLIHHILIIEL